MNTGRPHRRDRHGCVDTRRCHQRPRRSVGCGQRAVPAGPPWRIGGASTSHKNPRSTWPTTSTFSTPGSCRPGHSSGNQCIRTCSLPLFPREVSAGFFQERRLSSKTLILPFEFLQSGSFRNRQLSLGAAVGFSVFDQPVPEGLRAHTVRNSDVLDRLRGGDHLQTQLVLELPDESSS